MEPVGIKEIAERLGVQRKTVDQWLQRNVMPEAKWTVGGRPAWDWDDVGRWAVETGRMRDPTTDDAVMGWWFHARKKAITLAQAEQIARGANGPQNGSPSPGSQSTGASS